MKPLIVGELNPYGVDPRFALYPLPRNASGWRLRNILGLTDHRYLTAFERVNLCTGTWSMKGARCDASLIVQTRDNPLILLGAKVAEAFGVEFRPFTQGAAAGRGVVRSVYMLPHPSGRCRLWNEHGAFLRARRLVYPLIDLPAPKTIADVPERGFGMA